MPVESLRHAQIREATENLGRQLRPWLAKGNVQVIVPLRSGLFAHVLLREHLGPVMPGRARRIFFSSRMTLGSPKSLGVVRITPTEATRLKTRPMQGHETARPEKWLLEKFERQKTIDVPHLAAYFKRYARLFPGKRFLILDEFASTGATVKQLKYALQKAFPGREVKMAALGSLYPGNIDFAGSFIDQNIFTDTFDFINPIRLNVEKPQFVVIRMKNRAYVVRTPVLRATPASMRKFVSRVRQILGK